MHRDNLPSNTVAVRVDQADRLLSFSTAREDDVTSSTEYIALKEYQLPAHVTNKTVLRSELTETGRIAKNVDLVSYLTPPSPSSSSEDSNRFVFKYSTKSALEVWVEVQILARVPWHPNLVPVDRLVLDEVTGSKVVGFTMRYVAGETLDKAGRLLKLRWLKQLLQVVDDLNLKYGIMHNDIADRNLMIDRQTDSMLLIDFNVASPMNERREEYLFYRTGHGRREDVRSVLLFVYSFITHDPSAFRQCFGVPLPDRVEEKYFLKPTRLVKHPDVELDHDVAEFYFEVAAWIRRRRAGEQTTHRHAEGSEHIRWPVFPGIPKQMVYPLHAAWRETGNPYLDWSRPPKARLDPARRLLATGRYADEEPAAQKALAARKAGPKKPMVHHPGLLDLEESFKPPGLEAPSAPVSIRGHVPPADNRPGRPGARVDIPTATCNGSTREAAGKPGGVRRKLPRQQARSPAKWRQVGGGAGTRAGKRVLLAVEGSAKRRRSLDLESRLTSGKSPEVEG